MKLNGKDVFVCSCEETMTIEADALGKALGGDGALKPARYLCRTELDRFVDDARKADHILVACTQEAPLFLDALEEMGDDAPRCRIPQHPRKSRLVRSRPRQQETGRPKKQREKRAKERHRQNGGTDQRSLA